MELTRKEFIRMGVASMAALWGAVRDPFSLFAAARGKDWTMPAEGRIGYSSGQVFVNSRQAEAGDPVRTGDLVETGPVSQADVEMRDHSFFHLKENSSVRVSDILSRPAVEVKKGWFLIIVRKGTPFDIRTPVVLAGVRGTVIFFNVLEEEREYLCNCNGRIELVNPHTGDIIRSVKSSYHTAYDASGARGAVELVQAGLRYHTDEDILRMAERFPSETRVFKHKRDSGYSTGY
jgi:hypothetical protein